MLSVLCKGNQISQVGDISSKTCSELATTERADAGADFRKVPVDEARCVQSSSAAQGATEECSCLQSGLLALTRSSNARLAYLILLLGSSAVCAAV